MKRIIYILLTLSTSIFTIEFNSKEWIKKDIPGGAVYSKIKYDKIPTLCFHKIGNEDRYAITSESFEEFLIYLNDNKFYPLSDKEYIAKDLSRVPTGFKPIVLGSDDASEGNFIYKTEGSIESGAVISLDSTPLIDDRSMVGLLEKHLEPVNGKINFTFYVSYNGIPFRQTGGLKINDDFSGNNVIGAKLKYLSDNFIIGNHTFSHLVTKDITPEALKLELDKFYDVMYSYIGDDIKNITTLAYPYGCHDLPKEMEDMIRNYNYRGTKIVGGFDFNGYFAKTPFNKSVNFYDISRIGVDNKNIRNIYNFLETIPLYSSERVFVVTKGTDLSPYNLKSEDRVEEI